MKDHFVISGLWDLMVLLVWGFKKLEKPQEGRA
jgi:hypothetical protein